MAGKKDEPREQSELVQFKLRMKEGLRSRIEAAATKSGNSMNSEIIARLEGSLDYDSVFTPHLRPVLGVLAFDAWRVEKKSGKKWNEDRSTALAIAEIAGDTFRYGTPMADSEKVEEAVAKASDLRNSIERKLGYLIDAGAIVERRATGNALGGLLAHYSDPPAPDYGEKWKATISLLATFSYIPAIDLSASVKTWKLERDGIAVSFEEKVGIAAIFKSIGALSPDYEAALQKLSSASAAEDAAAAEAKRLVANLRG